MNRRDFMQLLSLGVSTAVMPSIGHTKNQEIINNLKTFPNTQKMPVVFLGHGDPMYAIEPNEFTHNFEKLAQKLPKPQAVLCISAHWQTLGSWLTAMPKPKTIHDFGGFPQALFDVQYPANGSPELANITQEMLTKKGFATHLDHQEWGLDHGTWSVLKYIFPLADVPIIQMSLDRHKTPLEHYTLAKELSALRRKGVLIVGSGNIVHNLRKLAFGSTGYFGYDWALEADEKIRHLILKGDHKSLMDYKSLGEAVKLAIPTEEHYLPLLYILALQEKTDEIDIFNHKAVEGSITMTSVAVGV